ncbi:MAG: septum formation initiator family protein [Patescibacteria group bacterium]
MSSRFSHTSGLTKIIIIVEFVLVSYLLYSLTKNVYNSYKVDKYIESFEKENSLIEMENKQKNEDYLYFTSEEYIDKIAKQNLGLVNHGEEVIILASAGVNEETEPGEDLSGEFAKDPKASNFMQWFKFFFED